MIDAKDFEVMRSEMESLEAVRESSILMSREIIRLSKLVVYSVQRDDFAFARKNLPILRSKVSKLMANSSVEEGHYRTALQEYVEAACFFGIVSKKELPTHVELGVAAEYYLLGLCDVGGEVVRRAINAAIKGNIDESYFLKDFLESMYGQFLSFDFRNGELRRKFDGIKYDLRKLEDLAFEVRKR